MDPTPTDPTLFEASELTRLRPGSLPYLQQREQRTREIWLREARRHVTSHSIPSLRAYRRALRRWRHACCRLPSTLHAETTRDGYATYQTIREVQMKLIALKLEGQSPLAAYGAVTDAGVSNIVPGDVDDNQETDQNLQSEDGTTVMWYQGYPATIVAPVAAGAKPFTAPPNGAVVFVGGFGGSTVSPFAIDPADLD